MGTSTDEPADASIIPNNSNNVKPPIRSILEHTFEGWSIWLEIDIQDGNSPVAKECEQLYQRYKHRQGVHPFLPHVTVLYNFPALDKTTGNEAKHQRAQRLLESVKERFQSQLQLQQQKQQPLLKPTDLYFFHYPKSADSGKGFGCVISLIVIEKEEWLSSLYTFVQEAFPKDERGGSMNPHLSLVYAPEDDLESLQMWTQILKEKRSDLLQPIPVRYLSLWSTQGSIKDWHRIAKVEF